MRPVEMKISKTLELLSMLSRSRQQFSEGLSEEEKATLSISKQLVNDAGLTTPEFTNSVHQLSEKGYVWHVVIFDDELRFQMNEFINGDQYPKVLEKMRELDTKEMSDKLKASVTEQLSTMLPNDVELDQKEIDKDHINFSEAFIDGIQAFKKMRPDEIALVILMPFRNIDILLQKMNDGERFEDIQDEGFWYDQTRFEFHIDEQIIPTSYQNRPNLVHTVLISFFSKPNVNKVEYEEMIGFDITKGNEAYRDAMRKFVKKNSKLEKMFSVHEYHTEFYSDKY